MKKRVLKWVRRYYTNVVNSIAFYPALIALSFLVLSYLLLLFDFSEPGKNLKAKLLDFISLKDASTARTIASTIAGGILSLTVFSFSMVMLLLNQAASNMTNRVLGSLIGNRFQQIVLGFYIGTIVYALFLLSTIRDIDSGVYVPALSVYLLILLTIIDIFLFIYFLHYITQSVKYETIIERIYTKTLNELKSHCHLKTAAPLQLDLPDRYTDFTARESGYFQGIEQETLLNLCTRHNWIIRFHYQVGSFIVYGTPILSIYTSKPVSEEMEIQLDLALNFYRGEPIEKNPYYGFKQLTEVAVKALSPGINDPGTAILSLHALIDLLTYRFNHHPTRTIADEHGTERIILQEEVVEELFEKSIAPIWDYGKEDRLLQTAMQQMLLQMIPLVKTEEGKALIQAYYQKTVQS
ncbi:DUF2254 domain-containing protein [Pontibacter sp. BT310]|uniref:DUF2254 domain-containing protein n=1 Tax=Pontibacter populi TaxID=890055 RepID=A0ABS6XFY2_9BACT|nr:MULTISPECIES: DUF2254 domain-containing protein [Pontibacter]MBJ6119938.1 DUF2254 domain-containing protein [Pontibacter sp. BT310]MBR0572367.1 DUF2254 domain-containing protein [Microvirga sp. STS03]MBW3366791.1 DUF2254 domain-containing protein [Pontibacter populi]